MVANPIIFKHLGVNIFWYVYGTLLKKRTKIGVTH